MIKVVIADDEEKVCQLICNIIDWKSLDMEIIGIAHDGIQALELIEKLNPDLMITDIRMPGYDGLEMISRGKELKKDLDFIIISGYRHFEYAQSAIKYGVCDYLLKPLKKSDLIRTLNKIRDKYIQNIDRMTNEEKLKLRLQSDIEKLRTWIFTEFIMQKSSVMHDIDIHEINEAYHFSFENEVFQVIAVKTDCGYKEDNDEGIKILEGKVYNYLSSLLSQFCYDMEVYFEDSIAYCLLNYSEENKKNIRKQIKTVLDELNIQGTVFNEFEFTIGIGEAVNNIENIKMSFNQAKFAVNQRLVLGTGKIIENSILEHHSGTNTEVLIAYINKNLSSAIEILDREAVLSSIEGLKEQCTQIIDDISGYEIFDTTEQVLNTYISSLRKNQVKLQDPEGIISKFHKYSHRCVSVNQLFEYLNLTILESIDKIIEDKRLADTKPIRTAKQYIQKNYMKPISLEEVSGIVGFNASYFSSLFKKETGINFLEYISEIRMGKAKEMLRETGLGISVICEEVGYNDIKHFTKSFKKYTGIKPNEYRKLYS